MRLTNLVKNCAYHSGLLELAGMTDRNDGVWILSYHSVSSPGHWSGCYASPSITLSPRAFENHIAYLSRYFRVVTMDDICRWLKTGAALPKKSVTITFDDGYKDNYLNAYPILKKYGVTATFYVVTDAIGNRRWLWTSEVRSLLYQAMTRRIDSICIASLHLHLTEGKTEESIRALCRIMGRSSRAGREDILRELRERVQPVEGHQVSHVMMNWDEVREMKRGGMLIGSHTISHPLLTEITEEEAELEIAGSKAVIERELNAPIAHFAYPNPGNSPHVNSSLKDVVRKAGYLTGRRTRKKKVTRDSDPFELNGANVGLAFNNHPASLAWTLNGLSRESRITRWRPTAADSENTMENPQKSETTL